MNTCVGYAWNRQKSYWQRPNMLSEQDAMDLRVFPTQYDFLTAKDQLLCWIAGVGAGKSWALAWWVLNECMKYPGNIGMVAAATNPQLRMATIPTFHEVFAEAGVEYEFSEWRGVCQFANGSWFKYQSLDIPSEQLKGSTLGFLAVDEVDACPEKHIEKLIGRLRRMHTSRRCRLIGNSPPPQHFLEYWFLPNRAGELGRKARGRLITSPTYENTLLPKDYIEKLEMQYPPGTNEHRRYVMGELGVPMEGVVLKEFESRHVVAESEVPWDRIVGYVNALDLGANHYTVLLRGALTDDDRLFIIDEHAARRTLLQEHAAAIQRIRTKQGASNMGTIFCDHDAQDRLELESLGVDTVPALKDSKLRNIDMVRRRLREDRLFIVGAKCPHLLSEIPYWVWHENKDEPIKKNDDCVDCLCYLVSGLDREADWFENGVADMAEAVS